ncbi:auxin-responsive protein SAUR64-like [Senna tora]|uniref:Auxin-responsive protein SAUR64-like n=1 Tax=Senna tora TaxID=362788 RepID=A0A834U3D3_9FABA|nr:auxin-responsive protein SAUR64-like [Senna tora]
MMMRHKLHYNNKVADKGHFVVYSIDKVRFVIPLSYLRTDLFKELFRLSEQEFGLPTDAPITFPCDASFLQYLLSLLQYDVSFDLLPLQTKTS